MEKRSTWRAGIFVGLFLLAISVTQVLSSPAVQASLPPTLQAQTTPDTPAQPATEFQAEEPIQAPYVPTPQVVVDKMLEMAAVGSNDLVYDLGSGDGRVVITAAQKFGARGIGIEIDPDLITLANENAEAAGVSDLVQFREQDLFTTDFSNATVVTLYLLQDMNLRLRPILLRQLKPGTRIISHSYTMGDWKPEETEVIQGPNKLHIIYKWTVPEVVPPELLQS